MLGINLKYGITAQVAQQLPIMHLTSFTRISAMLFHYQRIVTLECTCASYNTPATMGILTLDIINLIS